MNKTENHLEDLFTIAVLAFIVFVTVHLAIDRSFDSLSYGGTITTLFSAHRTFRKDGHLANFINAKYGQKMTATKEQQ